MAKYLFLADREYRDGYFSSEAGRLLIKVLTFHGIKINHCHVLGMFNPDDLTDLTDGEQTKLVRAISDQVVNRVHAHITSDTQYVIALGKLSILALTGASTISKVRIGRSKYAFESDGRDVPILGTVSPNTCLFSEKFFPDLVTDIGKLVNNAPEFVPPNFTVVEGEIEAVTLLRSYIRKAATSGYSQPFPAKSGPGKHTLVFDIEVGMDKDINFEHVANYAMLCVGIQFDDYPVAVLTNTSLTEDTYFLLRLLMDKCITVAHNGKFDLGGLRPLIGQVALGFDTMLASYYFDERTGTNSLKYLAQEYLGAPAYDDVLDSYIGNAKSKDFTKVPKNILYKYNAYDVWCTYLLYKMYTERLSNE